MPSNVGRAEIAITLTGDLMPVVEAFGIMSAALAAYGHEFTDRQMRVIARAAEILDGTTGQVVSFDPALAADPDSSL